jgi:hypothetical protein
VHVASGRSLALSIVRVILEARLCLPDTKGFKHLRIDHIGGIDPVIVINTLARDLRAEDGKIRGKSDPAACNKQLAMDEGMKLHVDCSAKQRLTLGFVCRHAICESHRKLKACEAHGHVGRVRLEPNSRHKMLLPEMGARGDDAHRELS